MFRVTCLRHPAIARPGSCFHGCAPQATFQLSGQRLLIAFRCLRLAPHAIFSKKLGFRRVSRLRVSGDRMVMDCRQARQDELPLFPVKPLKEGLQLGDSRGLSEVLGLFDTGTEETVQVNTKSHG